MMGILSKQLVAHNERRLFREFVPRAKQPISAKMTSPFDS